MVASITAIDDVNRSRPGQAWYVVGFLAIFYIFSMIDRTIFALVAAPISKDLDLTDAQMSLILGMGFAVVYAVAGLPLAHWLDTRQRKVIVTGGVLLWSAMTVAAAWATDFWTLLVLRSGLAFGEAVLTPAAVSMIGDMFTRERRALPMSFYASLGAIFSTGAYALGALVLKAATPIAPLIGLSPWRMTLILLGVPTMLLSLVFVLTVKEPARVTSNTGDSSASLGAFFRYLRSNLGFYIPLYIGFGLNASFGFGLYAWAPTVLQREHGVDPSTSGVVFGLAGALGGVLGALVAPQISARIERVLPMRGIPATLLAIATFQIPFAIFLPITPSTPLLYFAGFITVMCSTGGHLLGSLAFQQYADSRMRARLMAIYLLATGLIGLSIGPLLVVFFSGFWPADARPLAHGIAGLGLCTVPTSALCYILLYRGARRFGAVAG
jgi:MFS family permease